MLYQLSHFRSEDPPPPRGGAESQDRTGDTAIFSRVLYRLSYLGPMANRRLLVGGGNETTAFEAAISGARSASDGLRRGRPVPYQPGQLRRRLERRLAGQLHAAG